MGGSSDSLSDFFDESEFGEDIFSILESLEDIHGFGTGLGSEKNEETVKWLPFSSQKSTCSSETEPEPEPEGTSPKSKKQKTGSCSEEGNNDGQQKMSHITVERNRRKQMNEHLSMLRSLMPCFYVKRVTAVASASPYILYKSSHTTFRCCSLTVLSNTLSFSFTHTHHRS